MRTFIAIAAALAALAAGQACAQTDLPLKTSVSYADLDLSRASGRAVLEHRIDWAVGRVCQAQPSRLDLRGAEIYRKCRQSAWDSARQQLAAVYNGARFAQAAIQVGPGGN